MKRLVVLSLLALARLAAADPCDDRVVDPIVTPVRDAYLDAQRNACLRDEVSVALAPHALIDTPGFHGVLGGDLGVGARVVVKKAHELSAQLRLVDVAYVQNAVNKTTNLGIGPLVLGAAAGKPIGERGRAALIVRLELPFTRLRLDDSGADRATEIAGEVGGATTGRLTPTLTLDTRLGVIGATASSLGGRTSRLAFRAGVDLVWQPRTTVGLQAGTDWMAGWSHGFDDALLRAGVHWAIRGGTWRLRSGVGVPVGGSERTTAVVDLALLHDL